jgi:hypothetical protein
LSVKWRSFIEVLVRRCLVPAAIGFLAFVALGALAEPRFWTETWFLVGLGTVISATFVEPFFSRPQDAIANCAAASAVFVTFNREPVETLWLVYLAVCIVVFLAGIVATVTTQGPGSLKWLSHRLSSRLGRAVVLGPVALFLITLTMAARRQDGFEYIAVATAVLLAALAIDWYSLLAHVAHTPSLALAVGAVGPRVLQVVSLEDIQPGQPVKLETPGGSSSGTVLTKLPGKGGLQYRIALDREWTTLSTQFPADVGIQLVNEAHTVTGLVGEGSTDTKVVFEPLRRMSIGDPVVLRVDERKLLYQVASLRLTETGFGGAESLVSRAHAQMVGWPENGWIRGGTFLPDAHSTLFTDEDLAAALPNGLYEIGRIKGTALPVGMRVDDARRGHIAVLGMSGMGKTAAAQRICRALAASNVVIALDTTGEYATHLGVPRFANDFHTHDFTVHEPAGDPPQRACEFIELCMHEGNAEYTGGLPVVPRVVLLEEAHSFVPEWNFSLRNQQDHVAKSARMIMQARKFGVTFVIVSQRTAVVSKSALSQCENYIVLRTIDETSLDYLQTLVGTDLREAISALDRFDALCVGPAFNTDMPVIVSLTHP